MHLSCTYGYPEKARRSLKCLKKWCAVSEISSCRALPSWPREHDADRLLHAQVRVESESNLSMPAITDWNANAQITAQGFAVLGVEHAGSDHTELKLIHHCVTKTAQNAILLVLPISGGERLSSGIYK